MNNAGTEALLQAGTSLPLLDPQPAKPVPWHCRAAWEAFSIGSPEFADFARAAAELMGCEIYIEQMPRPLPYVHGQRNRLTAPAVVWTIEHQILGVRVQWMTSDAEPYSEERFRKHLALMADLIADEKAWYSVNKKPLPGIQKPAVFAPYMPGHLAHQALAAYQAQANAVQQSDLQTAMQNLQAISPLDDDAKQALFAAYRDRRRSCP